MNTRQAIQPSDQSAVLHLSFSHSRKRFAAGLSDGLRIFRTDNCLTTYHPHLPQHGGLSIVENLDDRYLAYVAGGRSPAGSLNVVVFWDALLGLEVTRFNLYEPIVGIRLTQKWLLVILSERVVLFEYQALQTPPTPPLDDADPNTATTETLKAEEQIRGPNRVKNIYSTLRNPHGLACLRENLLVVPAQTPGQIQLIPLPAGSKRVHRVSNSHVRCIAISADGTLLATASEQGTLVRVFHIQSLDQIAEFRRGIDQAIIFDMAFSPTNRWLASTSDKGTLHIFDLRPPNPATLPRDAGGHQQTVHRSRNASTAPVRQRHSSLEKETAFSTRSSAVTTPTVTTATHPASIQEYYGLRPPPTSASHSNSHAGAISALAAIRSSAFAPRLLKDVRSIFSAPFYMGDESPHWQGGTSHSWTTTPNGTRKRVRNPVPPLPSDPSGRPPKGIIAFADSPVAQSHNSSTATTTEASDEARLYVIGGGSDARWEMFEILSTQEGSGFGLFNQGFRKYLTKQFVD